MRSRTDKQRVIDLQRQVKIARDALKKIATERTHHPEKVAEDALEKLYSLDPQIPHPLLPVGEHGGYVHGRD